MKILWASDYFEYGGGLGFSVHNSKLRQALEGLGVQFVNSPQEAEIAVHVDLPDHFQPIAGIFNVLFTATEFSEPWLWSPIVERADMVVVPCAYSAEVVAKHYHGPIAVVPEGIDPDLFPYVERQEPAPDEPFRVLFVGNYGCFPRKGLDLVFSTWGAWLRSGRIPANVELYIKTTDFPFPDDNKGASFYQATPQTLSVVPHQLNFYSFQGFEPKPGASLPDPTAGAMYKRFERLQSFNYLGTHPVDTPVTPGMVIDLRTLSVQDLADLYRSAHAFLLPTRGEGWGLVLSDALASGLPSIWTHWSGPVDYAGPDPDGCEIGYPLKRFTNPVFGSAYGPNALGIPCYCAEADETEILEKLETVYHHYAEALELGRAASARMHTRYTWCQAATRFVEILEAHL